jgi:catechol 2,3-dioxygenase-like lactoylglutathione lyase family enzyme
MGTLNPGIAHLAFYVDDIWREYERLRTEGVTFRSDPVWSRKAGTAGLGTVYLTDLRPVRASPYRPAVVTGRT